MILSDVDIIEKIKAGEIQLLDPNNHNVIDPTTGAEVRKGQLQAHGYDLRVEAYYRWKGTDWIILKEGEAVTIAPSEFLVIRTYERIKLAKSVAGTVHSLARRTLLGLSHISSTIHPGWGTLEQQSEPIYVAVCNLSRNPLDLKRGDAFCRLMFHEVKTQPTANAPSLEQVREQFEEAKLKMAKRYSVRQQVEGWGLIAASILLAFVTLAFVQSYLPQNLNIAIPLVVSFLTIVIAAIRRRYNIVN